MIVGECPSESFVCLSPEHTRIVVSEDYMGKLNNQYTQTIYEIAVLYGQNGIFKLCEEDISALAGLLQFDAQKLATALSLGDEKAFKSSYNSSACKHMLFDVLIRCFFISKNIKDLDMDLSASDQTSVALDMLQKNIDILRDSFHHFEMANANLGTFSCLIANQFSLVHTLFADPQYNPNQQLTLLQSLLYNRENAVSDPSLVSLILRLVKYDLSTRANALYLIAIVQIIIHSPYFSPEIRAIADDLYCHLLEIFRNARLLAVQLNSLHLDTKIPIADRGKQNNTTRLLLLYGYGNYDAYALRLDFAHKGEGFIHYNNQSPGGIKSNLFTASQYAEIISSHPEASDLFIAYGNRYALKEKINIDFDANTSSLYSKLQALNTHISSFHDTFSEEHVLEFLAILSKMIPDRCYVPIDKTQAFAKHYFNFDYLMLLTRFLYTAEIDRDNASIKELKKAIVSRAVRYSIIDSEDPSFNTLDGINLILEEAEKVLIHP